MLHTAGSKWLEHSAWIRRLGVPVPLRSKHFLSQTFRHFSISNVKFTMHIYIHMYIIHLCPQPMNSFILSGSILLGWFYSFYPGKCSAKDTWMLSGSVGGWCGEMTVVITIPNIVNSGVIIMVSNIPDGKVHGADMGPIWGRQDPCGPHVGTMNLVIWDGILSEHYILQQVEYILSLQMS